MRHLSLLFICCIALPLFGQKNSSSCESGKAFLGVYTTDIDDDKAQLLGFSNDHGAYITTVYKSLAADEAGLKPFDYVIGINGKNITRSEDLSDLLREFQPGDEVNVRYVRLGQESQTTASLSDRMNWSTDWKYGSSGFLGITENDDTDDDEMGVLIDVVSNSSADRMGLRDGDLVEKINNQPMVDWQDISIAIDMLNEGDDIAIAYSRDGDRSVAEGTIGGKHSKSHSSSNSSSSKHSRGYMGFYEGEMSKEKAEILGFDNVYGSYVKSIIPGAASDEGGLEVFDYVVGINDYNFDNEMQLISVLSKYSPGDEVTVHYIRKGEKSSRTLVLGTSSQWNESKKPCTERAFFGVSPSNNSSADRGVAINVVSNSSAEDSGLEDGDVVFEMNEHQIVDWSDLTMAINSTAVGEKMTVKFTRDGREGETCYNMGSECDDREGNHEESESIFEMEEMEEYAEEEEIESGVASPAVDMNRIQVSMEDMDQQEANLMAEQGVEMALTNNLRIEDLSIYPNPNRGMFRLEFGLPQNGETSIQVLNDSGRLIYSFDMGEFSGSFSDEIDISQNGPGAYFLEVQQGDRSAVKKIILQY